MTDPSSFPFTATLEAEINGVRLKRQYRWRLNAGDFAAPWTRVDGEFMDADGNWRTLRNPDRKAALLALTPG